MLRFIGLVLAAGVWLAGGMAAAETIRLDDLPALPEAAVQPLQVDREPDPGRRLVLLNEDLVEMAAALGVSADVVAQTRVVGLPDAPQPEATFAQTPGVEGVLALRPTLVVASNKIRSARLMQGLEALGVNAVVVDGRHPAPRKVREFGALTGEEERAEAIAASIEADYASVPEARANDRPRVLHASTRGAGGNVSAAGEDTPAHGLIERAGGHNVGAEAGLERYQAVTPEGVVQMAPEVVVVAASELEALGGEAGIWSAVPGLALTPAAETRNLVVMRDLHIRANGASSGIAVKGLAGALDRLVP